jgi:hypothetical protein
MILFYLKQNTNSKATKKTVMATKTNRYATIKQAAK